MCHLVLWRQVWAFGLGSIFWHLTRWCVVGNRSSFKCKFYGNLFKDKNILSYHKMMNLCLNYTGSDTPKMYPMMTKVELKELNKLREKFGKTLWNHKRVAPPKLQKQPFGMWLPRPIHPKERKVYELSSNDAIRS